MEKWKDNISFILVDTMEPGNIGASARALKNCGFKRLELVRPGRFPSDEAGWFAHGADDILSAAGVFPELAPALKDKSLIIGTTRRSGKKRGLTYPVREAVGKIRRFAENNRVALLFGREDRGLTNDETAECSFMIRIPSSAGHPSFNLAQAVLIIAYEISFASYCVRLLPETVSNEELCNLSERLRHLMKTAGYAPKGIRDDENGIMADLKRLISRAGITPREARMLHGIISQVESSLGERNREP
jgi:TrmH family RNA methyltransferase